MGSVYPVFCVRSDFTVYKIAGFLGSGLGVRRICGWALFVRSGYGVRLKNSVTGVSDDRVQAQEGVARILLGSFNGGGIGSMSAFIL